LDYFSVSVLRDDRSAELVAQANHSRLDIAGLGIERVDGRSRCASELVALGLEGRVIVLEADDPVRGDAVFPAGADAPAVVPLRRRPRTRSGRRARSLMGASRRSLHLLGPPPERDWPSAIPVAGMYSIME
jgi:hypothetical protein